MALLRSLAALALVLAPAIAIAERSEALDRASLSVGVFNASLDTRLRAQAPERLQNRIDFERDLDLDRQQRLPRFAGTLLLGDRHQFGLSYFRVSRSGSTVIDREFEFGGESFRVDTPVDASLELSAASLTYTYWAWSSRRDAVGLSAGALFYRIEGGIEASGLPNGGSIGVSGEASGRVPVPQLGIAWRSALSDRWRLNLEASAFRARRSRVQGTVYDLTAGVEYFPWRNLGLLAELCDTRLDAETRRSSLDGELDLAFRGVRLGVKARW